MTMTDRRALLREADLFLQKHPQPKPAVVRVRYRGARPAWNWLAKQDEKAAAALWMVARERIPAAANDNASPSDARGVGVERRRNGKPRGRNPDPRSLDAYLALPTVQPRLADPEPSPVPSGTWDAAARGITIKSQEWIHPDAVFTGSTCFSFHPPAIAYGASFLGSIGGLGQPKMGKQRGDLRHIDEREIASPPRDIEIVIETMLAGGTVAAVGEALGANGGYADRRGGAALVAAGQWAIRAIAA